MTHEVFFFPNGNVAVCSRETHEQVPELQGSWLLKYMEFLRANGVDPERCIVYMPENKQATVFKTGEGTYNWRIT